VLLLLNEKPTSPHLTTQFAA